MNGFRSGFGALVLLALGIGADPVLAQGRITIGSNTLFDSGGGVIQAGCASLVVDGVAAGDWSGLDSVALGLTGALATRQLDFGGDWHSAGEHSVPGRVHWRQQCARGEGTLSGSHRFAHLAVTGHSGVTRRLDVDGEQLIEQSLRLQGANERLVLRSSVPGTAARLTLAPAASWQVDSVDVADIDSSAGQVIAPGDPGTYRSLDGGGNLNWFLGAVAIPVPALGPAALIILIFMVLLIALRHSSVFKPCHAAKGDLA